MAERIRPEVAVVVGRRIRALRAEGGLSVAQLGERSDVSRRMLTQIELGQANPSLGTVDRIASALGTTFAALVGVTGEPAPGGVSPDGVLVWSTPRGSWAYLLTAVEIEPYAVETWKWHLVAGDTYRVSPDLGTPDTMVHVLCGTLRVRPEAEGAAPVEVAASASTRITDRSAYVLEAVPDEVPGSAPDGSSGETDFMYVVMVPRGSVRRTVGPAAG
ncbi:MAG TPA: helix-turn-helix transcriptional regulator [Promicromonospora sp.]|nr:helix-turn-helix transcriptional regulator [Promicromonospora sp.]